MDLRCKTVISLVLACIRKSALITTDIDFTDVIDEAKKHKIESLIYNSLSQNREMLQIPENLLDELRVMVLYEGVQQEQGYSLLGEILEKMKTMDIKAIVLKGAYLRHLYPQPRLRSMSDYDLLLKPCDIEKAGRILAEYGYELSSDNDKHVSYSHEYLPGIEVHRRLIKKGLPFSSDEFESSVWERAVPYYINGTQTLTLCIQDHLKHIIMHMASHILGSGFGLRQLCDLTLFTETYNEMINWDEFSETLTSLHIFMFTAALFKICNILFELEVPKVFDIPCEIDILQDLIDNIFDNGVYGKPDAEHMTANLYIYFAGNKENTGRFYKLKDLFGIMFPGVDKLAPRYRYAEKCRILLPAAWIHRLVYCIFRRDVSSSVKTAVFTSRKSGEILSDKRALLKKLELVV